MCICSKNKGADQRLCFPIGKLFSHDTALFVPDDVVDK